MSNIYVNPMFWMGCDPGLDGAIALIGPQGEVWVKDMPTSTQKVGGKLKRRIVPELLAADVIEIIGCGSVTCFLERPSAMPGQGVTSSFNFGSNFGLIRGVLAALRIETHEVAPATWKKAMGLNSDKAGSLHKACCMFPKHAELFRLKKYEGRAEAALLAVYGRKVCNGR